MFKMFKKKVFLDVIKLLYFLTLCCRPVLSCFSSLFIDQYMPENIFTLASGVSRNIRLERNVFPIEKPLISLK